MATQKINGVWHVSNTEQGGGGGGSDPDAVKFTPQTLTNTQKTQARTNIGAGTSDFSGSYNDLTDIPSPPFIPGALQMNQLPDAGTYARASFESTYCAVSELMKVISGDYTSVSVSETDGSTVTTRELPAGGASVSSQGAATCEVYITYGEKIITISFAASSGDILVAETVVENTSNKVTSLSAQSTDTQYPSAKATYDAINPSVQSSQPVGGFEPGKKYRLGTLTGTVTFALANPTDNNIPNVYWWTFETSSTAPTVIWPSGVVWPDGFTPSVDAGKHYDVKVDDGYISYEVFTVPTA